ncbi:MAG: ankyrin repeat domain-containing protein [Desulfobacteraceae bacterium]|nr:ankyrin repeat domain-containing protein [Desulfobacteraceae bacterium]
MTLGSTKYPPSRSLYEYNDYQNGGNNNDNSASQAKRLQSLNQKNLPKADVSNINQNPDKAKTSVSLFKKLKQGFKKNFYTQNDKNKNLFEAAKMGNAILVQKWIDAGADVNMPDKNDRTLLFWAARKGHADVVELLLMRPEIDVNKGNPLYWAACIGHADVAELLIKDPRTDVNKENPLYLATVNEHVEIVKFLLKRSDVNVNKGNPLLWAAVNGYVEIVKSLLTRHDIKVNKGDSLSGAAWNGHADVVELLLSHPDIDVNGGDSLSGAAWNGHVKIVKLLLSHPNSCKKININKLNRNGFTPISEAAWNGHTDIVKLLLSRPEINLNKALGLLNPFLNTNDVNFIQAIVLKGCSKEVYDYLKDKAIKAASSKPQLLEIFNGDKFSGLVSGYANMEALDGYNQMSASASIPADLLNIIKFFLNPYLHRDSAPNVRMT